MASPNCPFSGSGRRDSAGALFIAALLCASLLTCTAHASNIFDDDWTPPAPPKPSPATVEPLTTEPGSQTGVMTPPALPERPELALPEPVPEVRAAPRRAIPPKLEQANSRKLLKTVFAKELTNRSAAGRRELAQKLLAAAATSGADASTDQFVLLIGAVDAAKDAANVVLCVKSVNALADAFDVDGQRLMIDTLLSMPLKANTAAVTVENCFAGLAVIDELVVTGNYTDSARLCAALRPAAAADPKLSAQLQSRQKDIDALKKATEALARQLEQLKAAPDDPAANLSVGKQLCFVLGRWERGLPMLAKGSDLALVSLSKRNLARPTSAVAQKELADGWWDIAASQPPAIAERCKARAADWYKLAEPELKGLAKVVVQQRLALMVPRDTDLLAKIDLSKDVIRGGFQRTSDGIVKTDDGEDTARLSYEFPTQYDLSVTYTYKKVFSSSSTIYLCIPFGGQLRQFGLKMNPDGYGFGFWSAGKPLEGSRGATYIKARPALGIPYHILLKVRQQSVQGFLNGRPIYSLSGSDGLKVADERTAVVGVTTGAGIIQDIRVSPVQ